MAKKEFKGVDALIGGSKREREERRAENSPVKQSSEDKVKSTSFVLDETLFLNFKSWCIINKVEINDFLVTLVDEVVNKGEISEKDKIKKIIFSEDDVTFKKTFRVESSKFTLFKSLLARNNIKMKDYFVYRIEQTVKS